MAVAHHSEHLLPAHYNTEKQLGSMSPRRRLHHDNSCYDNGQKIHHGSGCCDDGQRHIYPDNNSYDDSQPMPQGIAEGRLFRSRSEETLSNMSFLPRRRLSTVRRRKKVATAAADQLINDFNDGKEVDLDRLTAGVAVASDSFGGNGERVGKMEESDRVSTQANVLSWLRTQNDPSKRTGSSSNYHSLDVHHL